MIFYNVSFNKIAKLLFYLFFIIALFISLYVRFGNLDQDFWYDEAGQYWISQGQNHFSVDFKDKGISGFFENNKHFNLDPPLFGFLLRFWVGINDSLFWLRLLPGIFGIMTIVFLYKTLKLLDISSLVTALVTLTVFSTAQFVFYSQELRAYSFGMLLSTVTFYYFLKYLNHHNEIKDFIMLTIFSVFAISTLYSLWLLIGLIALFMFSIAVEEKNYRIIKSLVVYILVILIFIVPIYFGQMSYQLIGFNLPYARSYELGGTHSVNVLIGEIARLNLGFIQFVFGFTTPMRDLFFQLISSKEYFILIISVTAVAVYLIFSSLRKAPFKFLLPLIFYFILMFGLHILSILNKFPIGGNRWNLFQVPIFLVILAIVLHLLIKKYYWLKIPITIFFILIIVINLDTDLNNPRKSNDLRNLLNEVSLKNTPTYIYSYGDMPTFKYNFKEYDASLIIFRPPDSQYSTETELNNFKSFLESEEVKENSMRRFAIVATEVKLDNKHLIELIIRKYSINNKFRLSKFSAGNSTIYVLEKI